MNFSDAQVVFTEPPPVAIRDMDDATLESAAILAALTHSTTHSREAWSRLLNINAERRRRKS